MRVQRNGHSYTADGMYVDFTFKIHILLEKFYFSEPLLLRYTFAHRCTHKYVSSIIYNLTKLETTEMS